MSKKIDASKLQGFFAKLMEEDPANKLCADCHTKNPRWASTNLGVFLCIKCAGIHRSIGTHITKVKSITLDGWEESQLAVMQRVGNTTAAAIWEYNMPESVARERPNESSSSAVLERWIRNKYERKLYFSQSAFDAAFSGSSTEKPAAKPQATSVTPVPQSSRSSMPRRPSGGSKQDLFDFGTPAPASTSAPAPAPAPKSAPASSSTAPTASLDDIFGGYSSASGSQTSSQQSQQQPKQQSNADIMALFGSTPASTQTMLTPTPMTPMNASGGGSMAGSSGSASTAPRQGNYDVDMRAYGVYRHPSCVQQQQMTPQQMQMQQMRAMQQMTPQQRAYYEQMQRQQQMMMDPTLRTYNTNYQRFA